MKGSQQRDRRCWVIMECLRLLCEAEIEIWSTQGNYIESDAKAGMRGLGEICAGGFSRSLIFRISRNPRIHGLPSTTSYCTIISRVGGIIQGATQWPETETTENSTFRPPHGLSLL